MTRLTKINLLCNKNLLNNNKFLFLNNRSNNMNIKDYYKKISCNIYIKTKDIKTVYYHDDIVNDNMQRVSIIYNNNCSVTIIASSIDDIFNK